MTMLNTQARALQFQVDSEHGGIRTVVMGTFFVVFVMGFAIANTLLPTQGLNIVAFLIAIGAGGLVAVPLERVLKKRWPSGRIVTLEADRVRLTKNGATEQEMMASDAAQIMFWRFEVQKRTRIPKGWSMLGCAIEHEGSYLVIYTFVSPDALKTFDGADRFKALVSRKDATGQKDVRENMRMAGEQRRLRDAEAHRWNFGAEMTLNDFVTYLKQIETQFPEWMPLN